MRFPLTINYLSFLVDMIIAAKGFVHFSQEHE